MRRRWSEPRDTCAAPYSPTRVATNTSPVCSETRRTPSRPRPCHPRKLDEAMATSLRDCGFYSSSVRILVWSCFFFMCAASTPDIGPTAKLPTHGCWLQQEKHGPTGDL